MLPGRVHSAGHAAGAVQCRVFTRMQTADAAPHRARRLLNRLASATTQPCGIRCYRRNPVAFLACLCFCRSGTGMPRQRRSATSSWQVCKAAQLGDTSQEGQGCTCFPNTYSALLLVRAWLELILLPPHLRALPCCPRCRAGSGAGASVGLHPTVGRHAQAAAGAGGLAGNIGAKYLCAFACAMLVLAHGTSLRSPPCLQPAFGTLSFTNVSTTVSPTSNHKTPPTSSRSAAHTRGACSTLRPTCARCTAAGSTPRPCARRHTMMPRCRTCRRDWDS